MGFLEGGAAGLGLLFVGQDGLLGVGVLGLFFWQEGFSEPVELMDAGKQG